MAEDVDRRLGDVLEHRPVGEQVELLEDHAHPLPNLPELHFRRPLAVSSKRRCGSVLRLKVSEAVDRPQKRALAAAGGAEQPLTSPLLDHQRDASEDLELAEPLADSRDLDHGRGLPPDAAPSALDHEDRQRQAHRQVEEGRHQRQPDTAPVLLARMEYGLVSSTTVITEQTEVSLNMAMKSFITGGITIRTACGMTIRRSASRDDMPSDRAASIWPRGIACKPAR